MYIYIHMHIYIYVYRIFSIFIYLDLWKIRLVIVGDDCPPKKEATIEKLEHGNASTKPSEIGISLKTSGDYPISTRQMFSIPG